MGQKLPQAVFLDRDGTIGERGKKRSLLPDEFIPYPFLPDTIAALKAKGIRVISFTNQPWISRGEASYEALEKQLLSFGFDTVCICPHDDGDGCSCRKPLPGLLTKAAAALDLDLTDCIVIGDSWRDMIAAHSAGAKKILVKTGEGRKSLVKMNDEYPFVKIDHVCENLQEAAALILASNENTLCGGTDMLHLETITPRNVWDVIELEVYESQENFVAENTISIVQAYAVRDTETSAFPFGIYDGPTPVGFLMVGFNEAASYDDDVRLDDAGLIALFVLSYLCDVIGLIADLRLDLHAFPERLDAHAHVRLAVYRHKT